MIPEYYLKIISDLVQDKVINTDDRILVVAGGQVDKEVYTQIGFDHVVISNLDERMTGDEYLPYEWSYQDAENLTYDDEIFDFCIVHQGLHHCHSPSRALLEMYRASRKGLVLFEPYDNLVTRIGVCLNVGQEYETAAVFDNDLTYGGVGNSRIPNYIYRWTKEEIRKTIKTFAPYGKHQFRFIHHMEVPWQQLKMRKNKLYYYALCMLYPALKCMQLVSPAQCNIFAAVVLKPDMPKDIFAWLTWDGKEFLPNHEWFNSKYKS